MHAGAVQVPALALHRAALAQALPLLAKAVRSVLQTWGWAPLHLCSFTPQVGAVQVPVLPLHSAAVAQALPAASQPLRFELHTCGWVPTQRCSPTAQVGV